MLKLPVNPDDIYREKEDATRASTGNFLMARNISLNYHFNACYEQIEYANSLYEVNQRVSGRFREHLNYVADKICDTIDKTGKTLEIGCGKGFFVDLLRSKGVANIKGYDTSYSGDSRFIEKRYFDERDLGFEAETIILRHTLEHIPNPVVALQSMIRINQNPSALLVIEVPCFDWIRKNEAWWDVTYEHCNYFTKDFFSNLFSDCKIYSCFEDQYLLVFARSDKMKYSGAEEDVATEYIEIGDIFNFFKQDSKESLEGCQAISRKRFWIWGCATKGTMFAYHMMKRFPSSPQPVGCVDINDKKHNSFMAGTGYKISAPSCLYKNAKDDDLVIVTNPNYVNEVKELLKLNTTRRLIVKSL